MNSDQQLISALAEIQKQLVIITQHLKTLTTIAQHAHPEVFAKPGQKPPARDRE